MNANVPRVVHTSHKNLIEKYINIRVITPTIQMVSNNSEWVTPSSKVRALGEPSVHSLYYYKLMLVQCQAA